MEQCQKRKILLLVLAICIAFTVINTEILANSNLDHDCMGVACYICLIIQTAKNFLKNLHLAALCFCLAVLLMCIALINQNYPETRLFFFSPIAFKVRFNS